MKKVIKILISGILSVIVCFLFIFWLFHEREYHIKTEFGDCFTVYGGGLTDDYCILDDNSDIIASIVAYYGVKDFQAICDSDYLRCYRILNEKEDMYIMKIKKYDFFFVIDKSDKEYMEYIFNSQYSQLGEIIKSEFLCDLNLMEIVLPYLNQVYHDEMIMIAQKMVSGDFQALNQYGLSQEMINDKNSLQQKIQRMKSFLNENEE